MMQDGRTKETEYMGCESYIVSMGKHSLGGNVLSESVGSR